MNSGASLVSKISSVFQDLKDKNQKAFIPFITAGDGGMELTLELMHQLVDDGASIIELGVPFSDPMADGPVIAKSHERSVARGYGLANVLELVSKFREMNDTTPIVLMGYLNPIEMFGYEDFANAARSAGVDGVLVVDMPPEESQELKRILSNSEIDFIFLVAPTTTDERLNFLSQVASGFIYFVSLKGVTGAGNINVDEVTSNLSRIRKFISLPVGVGFGIEDGKTAKEISAKSDAIIVGSVLVSIVDEFSNDKNKLMSQMKEKSLEISQVLR